MRHMQQREKKESTAVDSAVTSGFWLPEDEHEPTDEPSDKIVAMADGFPSTTANKARSPNERLNDEARELDLMPHSVRNFAQKRVPL